jgi:hypothetical protein
MCHHLYIKLKIVGRTSWEEYFFAGKKTPTVSKVKQKTN